MPAYAIKPLVTAIAINTGGRNGHSETTDHSVSVNLSVRKETGGPGLPDTTTPEHLFAAGYAGCFGGAIEFVARQHKKDVKGAVVTCHTSVGPREGGGFGIAVKMQVKIPTLLKDEALALVEETHEKVCTAMRRVETSTFLSKSKAPKQRGNFRLSPLSILRQTKAGS
jgi:osmotically inducible protein OsmC